MFSRCTRDQRSPRVRGLLRGVVFASAMFATLSSPAPCVTVGGPFTLTTPDGTTVTDQTYRGKWLVVYFGFTYCPLACPTALFEIVAALEQLGPDAAEVQPLFITVDPQRDTPEVLREYTASFDPRIVGLTGTPAQIESAAREYGVYFIAQQTGPGADDYTIDHSTYLYLIDPAGRFVRGFDADASGKQIAAVIRGLLTQSNDRTHPESSSAQTGK